MNKILIWGTGQRADDYMRKNYFAENIVVGFIDSSSKMSSFYGYPVYEPKMAYKKANEIDYIIIATKYYTEIYRMLIDHNVPKEKIVFTDCVQESPYINDYEVIKKISEKLYGIMTVTSSKRMIGMNERDALDDRRIIGVDDFRDDVYMNDYFRYRTFEFIANELIDNDVQGKVAEVGVFKGVFARLINEKFKDKQFYLFDSFEGFDEEEVNEEMKLGRCDQAFKERYKQTSEKMVLDKMKYPEKCKIFKGLFPASVTEEVEESEFAFVSLDVDLEESTYQGLQFFYPRLSEGGVIYVHDYNSSHLFGVRSALHRYERDNGITFKKIPLADQCGTLVIIK